MTNNGNLYDFCTTTIVADEHVFNIPEKCMPFDMK